MTCPRVKLDQLIQYVDRSLLPDEMATICDHLCECTDCQSEVAELESIVAAVAQLPEPVEPERDFWSALAPSVVKPDRLVSRLGEAIALRDVVAATRLADDCRDSIADMNPCDTHSAALLDAFAQVLDMGMARWGSDLGYSYLDVAKAAIAKFPKYPHDGVRLDVCAHLEMVEGILAMHSEQFDAAIPHFRFVASLGAQVSEQELGIKANYYLASAHSKKGLYSKAGRRIDKAISLAREAKRPEMTAACEVLKGWILLQQNQVREAEQTLVQAMVVLKKTTDCLSLGNIEGSMGRIALREGLNTDALEHFDRALAHYKKYDNRHRNVARTLVNKAFVERLIAVRSSKTVQISPFAKSEGEASRLREQARRNLDEAEAIYSSCCKGSAHGKCRAITIRALLELDESRFAEALELAEAAEEVALASKNCILASRARIIQCMAESARSEASGEEWGLSAERARAHALVALRQAECTQRKRLVARARIWLGITNLNPYFNDTAAAVKEYGKAVELLGENDRDHVWDDLQLLKCKLNAAGIAVPDLAPSSFAK